MNPFRAIGNFFSRTLGKMFDDRMKRLIMLSSFAARISRKKFDQATIQKLNQTLELSHVDSALKSPIHLSELIWRTEGVNHNLLNGQFGTDPSALQQIVEACPGWLRYESPMKMREDLQRLLDNRAILE